MLLNIILLLTGFALLIKGADFLVLGSSSLARRFNISELVIGLTIVALGTSAPEMVVSVIAAMKGQNDVAIGNVIGSNIFNLFLILGVAAMITPIVVQHSTIVKEIPYTIIAAFMLMLLANDHLYTDSRANRIGFIDGLILLALFAIFLYYVFRNMKNDNQEMSSDKKTFGLWKSLLLILTGLAGLVLGGSLSVNNAVDIAHTLGISERIIGLTIVAAGTSLPELATSAVAAYRKNADIAVGNIVGSNIFNILLVLATSALLQPLPYQLTFNTDITFLIGGTMLLLLFTYTGKKAVIQRWQGTALVLLFIGYTITLIVS
ncbi:MAG: calcium/sodium antiporter [Bacteroidales bacterium]